MKTIRFLILIAIVALVALAFLNRSPDNPEQQDAINAFMQPIQEMQQKIGQNFPQLREDLEQLKNKIRDRVAAIDPKSLIPIHLPTTASALPADLAAPPEEAQKPPLENSEVSKQVQDLAGNIKNMNADELAKRMKEIYERLQKYSQSPNAAPEAAKTPAAK
jgi:hypothetical protein